ncbi:MAG: oxygenase MpaB family protein [Actinomycetes bacterium]
MKERIANRFRQIVSGSPDGRPDWVKLIAHGEGVGLFGPGSAVWQVHGTVATLVGGIRALLLQAAHPAALTGVSQHSRYETDPLGRLAGTSRWLTITTFGSTEAIANEAARVNSMHDHVKGDFQSKSGEVKHYRASDPRYLLWVHCAFTDSFLAAHQAFGYPIDEGADAYVREWSQSALGLGLKEAPQSVAELKATMDEFLVTDLAPSAATAEVVKFILKPPLGISSLIFYLVLAKSAISTLTPAQQKILGLKPVNRSWRRVCAVLLKLLSLALGKESPSQEVARERIARTSR